MEAFSLRFFINPPVELGGLYRLFGYQTNDPDAIPAGIRIVQFWDIREKINHPALESMAQDGCPDGQIILLSQEF